MLDTRKAFVPAAIGGACFGVADSLLVMRGGLPLLLGNVAALWLTVGLLAGRLSRGPAASAALGAVAETVAVVAFYATKAPREGVPVLPATVWLTLALLSGAVMGWLASPDSPRRRRGGLLVLGMAWCCEPAGWTALHMLHGAPAAWRGREIAVWALQLAVGACLIGGSALLGRSPSHT